MILVRVHNLNGLIWFKKIPRIIYMILEVMKKLLRKTCQKWLDIKDLLQLQGHKVERKDIRLDLIYFVLFIFVKI